MPALSCWFREPAVWIHSLYTQMRSYTLKPPSFRQFLTRPLPDAEPG